MRKRVSERERERDRERDRERERVKTGRQAGGFTLLAIKLHKQTKNVHVKRLYGFIGTKYQRSARHFWILPAFHILPFKRIHVYFSEPLFIGKMYFECISKQTNKFGLDIGY